MWWLYWGYHQSWLSMPTIPHGSSHPTHGPGPHVSPPRAICPCPSATTAGLGSSSSQPYPAQPWSPLSWARSGTHVPAQPWSIPTPVEADDAPGWGLSWCPSVALLLAGAWDGPWVAGSALMNPRGKPPAPNSSSALINLDVILSLMPFPSIQGCVSSSQGIWPFCCTRKSKMFYFHR